MFSAASIATMTACIFLFGLFFSLLINFRYIVKNAEEGVAVTVMRPSGKVRIDGDDYDAISYYNTYLDPGTPVKVVKVENMQLYVVSVNVDEK